MKKEISFGENFKKYRKRKGISQREFASILYQETGRQLTLTSISNYETGLHLPPPQILPVIARILGVSLDALFGTDNTPAVSAGEEDLLYIREYKKEMEALLEEFISIKSQLKNSGKKNEVPVIQGERLLKIIESQQGELLSGQAQLATVRKMIAHFRDKF